MILQAAVGRKGCSMANPWAAHACGHTGLVSENSRICKAEHRPGRLRMLTTPSIIFCEIPLFSSQVERRLFVFHILWVVFSLFISCVPTFSFAISVTSSSCRRSPKPKPKKILNRSFEVFVVLVQTFPAAYTKVSPIRQAIIFDNCVSETWPNLPQLLGL